MATTFPETRRREAPDLINRLLARVVTADWETIAYFAIFVLAIVTRFVNLGARVMSHDESLHTYYSWRLEQFGDYQHTPLMHGPILFHITALSYFLFGDSDFTARIYPALLGVLLVMMPILFRRWLGRWGALLASVLLLISPLLMYYERYIREDIPAIFSAVLMVYAIFMYVDGPEHLRRKARWLYLLAGAMLWCLGSKESAFIYIAIFGSVVTLYWLVRVFQWLRKQPSLRLFRFLTIAVLLGSVTALAMYMVFSIALSNYANLTDRMNYIGQQITGAQPLGYDFSVFVTWTLLVVAAVIIIVVGTALWATRRGGRLRVPEIILFLLIALAVCLALIAFEELTFTPKITAEEAETVVVADINALPIVAAWIVGVVGCVLLVVSRAAGWWRRLHRFPELDVLIVMGTLVLPWLTSFVLKATGADPTDYSQLGIQRTVAALIPFLALSIVTGLVWNWKRWLICVLVFYIPFAFFFTTMFTNPLGLATGMIGSLGYWLNQQGVQRGSQPRYYYALVIMPVYEYLPLIGGFLAMLAGLTTFWRGARQPSRLALNQDVTEPLPEAEPVETALPVLSRPGALRRLSFPLFASWWAIFNFIGYTLAGEKMPWLGTHMTVPLILLTAWYFGRVFEHVDWVKFRSRGWLYLILLPLLGVALFQAASPFLVGNSPFAGLERQQLTAFYQWLAVIGVALLVIYLIVQVILSKGFAHFRRMVGVAAFLALSLLTFRTALMASFINYDFANEYLVYAHGAPGVKRMMQEIEDISLRTTDGMSVRFAWGGNAWPVTWYFRHLTNASFFAGNPTPQALNDAVMVYVSDDIKARVDPLLEDRYYQFHWIRMWWPDQDYFYLTGQRVLNALDFSPENTQAAQIRRGMFDIWWKRDYTTYGQAIGKDYSLEHWPVSEGLTLYVRKDVAAQVWNLGSGEGTVLNPLADQATNVCTSNWQQKPADLVFNAGDGIAMNHPLDISVDDANNRVYVAEEFNNRVSVFDRQGNYLTSIQNGQGGFVENLTRPNGVAVAPNSSVYVADTWNYLIREFAPDGSLLRTWGQPGQYGAEAQTDPVDGFWGPRDVEVDGNGNVYVADTGNKRVRVYDGDGNYLRDIGSAGSGLGQLDEPSGLAIDREQQRLYVADTWNQRVSVFGLDGTPQFTFPVRGWYEDQGNRPYLAIDPVRHLIYVTDPDAGRVLVYDLQGNCVGSFGQPSDSPIANTEFDTTAGIAVDADGNVYVADSAAGRVLRFAPFVDTVMPLPDDQSGGVLVVPQEDQSETEIVLPPQDSDLSATEQVTPEAPVG